MRPAALWRSCHPEPTVTVSLVGGVLAFAGGRPLWQVAVVTASVLAGQLSVGWSNDWIDADRDRRNGRADKPVAAGTVSRAVVGWCAVVALAVAVALSLVIGVRGLWHVAALASAWAYNHPLKRTVLSPAPFALSFGALVYYAVPDASWTLVLAGACLGVGAHFANVIPDLADDAATGVRGLPHRLGERAATVVAATALVVTTGLLASRLALWWLPVAIVAVPFLVTLARPGWAFRVVQLVAVVDVVLLLTVVP